MKKAVLIFVALFTLVSLATADQPKVVEAKITPEKARKILDEHIIGGNIVEDFVIGVGSERVG